MTDRDDSLRTTIHLLAIATAIAVLGGCVTATVHETRQGVTGIFGGEAIAILGRTNQTRDATEASFLRCIGKGVGSGRGALNVVRNEVFINELYPWFEPRTAPVEMHELSRLIDIPLVSERLGELNVRYIVWVEGSTVRKQGSGTMQCGVGTGGIPMCYGWVSWDAEANYEATIWDVSNQRQVGKLGAEAFGTSFVPAIVAPLPFIARVQNTACTKLAQQIKPFIDSSEKQ